MIDDTLIIGLTGAGTGVGVVWLARLSIANYINRTEKFRDETAKDIRHLLQETAVVRHEIDTIKRDINGLGNAMRARLK